MENEECGEAYVAGVRNGRGRKFGREITREGGGVGNLGARRRAREKGWAGQAKCGVV